MYLRHTLKRILVIMALALFVACQEEKVEIKLPPEGTVITNSTPVTKLIMQVALRDGSPDNILDKSSCLSLLFPVTIFTNGQTITVNSLDDLDEIEELFDNSGDDGVDFVFPIKVRLPDHSELALNDENELKSLISSCKPDDDIECIDFQYPIQFNSYDANNQVAGTITISSDEELYNFLLQLEKDELVGLKFPVTLIPSNNNKIVVTNFKELEDAIEDSIDDCDEDDDNDFNDDDVDDSDFVSMLTNGNWMVESFVDGDENQTSDFEGYAFTFNTDHSVEAVKASTTITGVWTTSGDSGEIELLLEMSSTDPFDDISEDWTVITFSASAIRLENGDDDNKRILVFKKL